MATDLTALEKRFLADEFLADEMLRSLLDIEHMSRRLYWDLRQGKSNRQAQLDTAEAFCFAIRERAEAAKSILTATLGQQPTSHERRSDSTPRHGYDSGPLPGPPAKR